MVGLGTAGYQTDQFDNLTVTPTGTTGSATGPVVSGASASKCLDDDTGSSANGAKVQIWDCNGTAAQNWAVGTDGTVRINGTCMDVTGASTADGALVELWDCNGGTNQQWIPQIGTLDNPVSGKCLDDPDFNTANGTQLELYSCNGGANQQWRTPQP